MLFIEVHIADDNNKVLLQFVVEMCDKKLDNLTFIGDIHKSKIVLNNCCSSNNKQFVFNFLNMLRYV